MEPGVVIKAHAKVGDYGFLGAGAVIGRGVEIGAHCRVGAGATVSHALLGDHVTLFPGVRIGQAGFGFAMDAKGFLTMPQLGRVLIEDRVEIGANTTIDRGSLKDTKIGFGTRIDNLVMIGHNVEVGRHCVLVAQVGIAGSTRLGDHVVIAGQAGLAGHIKIGSGVQVAAQSGIMKDLPDGAVVGGSPCVPIKQWMRQQVALARLVKDGTKS